MLAGEFATLLHKLEFAAIVRDPVTAAVIASSPAAEQALLAADPGSVRVASGQLGGFAIRVEAVRESADEPIELTPRQSAVAELLGEGLRNREIAVKLRISTHTVRRHVESILRRLQVPNRTAAAGELRKGRVRVRG
ncbi:MAG: LuxR C-terminal-related transcriptional regulator [Gemmatimonadaceae bacterium]